MVRRLLFLNGLGVLGAVLYHASGWGFVAMFFWTHRYLPVTSPNFDQLNSAQYFGLRFIEQLINFSIPAFLFVSGFFVAFATGRDQATVKWSWILTRLRFLVIPYLLWSVVMLLAEFVLGERYSLAQYARRLVLGQATPAFYFVPLICQLYLLSPWLVRLARKHWPLLLFSVAFIQMATHLIQYALILEVDLPVQKMLATLAAGWFFPGNLFWFSFGIVVGFHHASFKAWLIRWRWVWLAVTAVLFWVCMTEWEVLLTMSNRDWLTPKETLLDTIYSFFFLLTFLAFENVAYPLSKQVGDLGSKSFGIYLVHSLVLTYLSKIVYHLAPWILSLQILYQPLLVAAGLGVPLLLMALVKNSPARRTYQYQFG